MLIPSVADQFMSAGKYDGAKAVLLRFFGALAFLALAGGFANRARSLFRRPRTVARNSGIRDILAVTALWMAAIIASAIFSICPEVSLLGESTRGNGAASWIACASIFALIATRCRSRAQVERILLAVAAGSTIPVLVGLAQWCGYGAFVPDEGLAEGRVWSTFGNPIMFGGYLLAAIFATARFVFARRARSVRGGRRHLFSALLLAQTALLFASGSRGPMLGLAVGAMLLALLAWRERGYKNAATAASFAFVALMVVFLGGVQLVASSGIASSRAGADGAGHRFNTVKVRVLLYKALTDRMFFDGNPVGALLPKHGAERAISESSPLGSYLNPAPDRRMSTRRLIGYGCDTLAEALLSEVGPDYEKEEGYDRIPDSTHSQMMDVLGGTGFIGLAFYCAFLVMIVRAARHALRLDAPRKTRNIGALLWMGAIVAAVSAVIALWGVFAWAIGILIGALLGMFMMVGIMTYGERRRDGDPASASRAGCAVAAACAAVAALWTEMQFGVGSVGEMLMLFVMCGVIVAEGELARNEMAAFEPSAEDSEEANGWAGALLIVAAILAMTGGVISNGAGERDAFALLSSELVRDGGWIIPLGVALWLAWPRMVRPRWWPLWVALFFAAIFAHSMFLAMALPEPGQDLIRSLMAIVETYSLADTARMMIVAAAFVGIFAAPGRLRERRFLAQAAVRLIMVAPLCGIMYLTMLAGHVFADHLNTVAKIVARDIGHYEAYRLIGGFRVDFPYCISDPRFLPPGQVVGKPFMPSISEYTSRNSYFDNERSELCTIPQSELGKFRPEDNPLNGPNHRKYTRRAHLRRLFYAPWCVCEGRLYDSSDPMNTGFAGPALWRSVELAPKLTAYRRRFVLSLMNDERRRRDVGMQGIANEVDEILKLDPENPMALMMQFRIARSMADQARDEQGKMRHFSDAAIYAKRALGGDLKGNLLNADAIRRDLAGVELEFRNRGLPVPEYTPPRGVEIPPAFDPPPNPDAGFLERLVLKGAIAFVFALMLTPLCRAIARRTNFVDKPAARKEHLVPTPLMGGIAIILAVCAADAWIMLMNGRAESPLPRVLAASSILGAIGLCDDRRPLPWQLRFAAQIGVALWLCHAGVAVQLAWLPAWANRAISVVWFVGITNAVNFLDNMNGLSAGLSAITFGFIALLGAYNGCYEVSMLAFAVACACMGFLRYNHNWRATIFMGDAGSMFLGSMLACLALLLRFSSNNNYVTWLCPVLLLAVPVFDMSHVCLARIRRGRNPFSTPGKDHTSHLLARLGMPNHAAVLVLHLAALACGLLATIAAYANIFLAYGIAGLVASVAVFAIIFFELHFPPDALRVNPPARPA